MAQPVLSVAVVNYNSGYRLRQCVESLLAHRPSMPFEVVVVDNASKDGSADFLRDNTRPEVAVVWSPVNLGYTGGYNEAFRRSAGKYVLILNSDLVALPGSLDNLVRHMEEDPSIGAIGGWQLRKDGSFEKYANRFPRPYDLYLTNFVRREKAERDEGFRRYHMTDVDFSGPVEVPQPAGGCLLVRRDLFPEGLMSPAFGIFFSDVEMARKVHARGKRIMMFPDAPFVHDHDRSQKPVTERSLLVDLDYYVGCARYFRMYEGRWAALQVKALFGARLLGRLLLVELPAALRGEQPWRIWRARAALLWNFLRERNVLLERHLAPALPEGVRTDRPSARDGRAG